MIQQESVEEKAIIDIGERYSALRIVNPQAEAAIAKSLEKYGQMSPVICVKTAEGYELVDGFKRLRACRKLNWPTVKTVTIETGARVCKAAIIQLNRVGRSISDLEEALVLQSLFRDDGLTQVEIAALLGRHKSWVSRRISLVERLNEEVRQDIGLGLVSVSIGRELAKLPRGNQPEVLKAIRKHRLSKRDVEKLVAYLKTQPGWNYSAVLYQPWEVIPLGEPLPIGIKGQLISLQRLCKTVVDWSKEVSPDEVAKLSPFIAEAIVSAKKVSQTLKRVCEVDT